MNGEFDIVARPSARGQVVRVRLGADVAYNLDKFQSATKRLAELLGCKPCLSGARCYFQGIEDFVTNPAGELVADVPGAGR